MLAVSFASCRDFSFTSFLRGDAIATAGDGKLYIEDVQALFTGDITPEDSLKLLNSYVDQWVKQQLKIQVAQATSPEEEERISRMVNDYRNSLLIYEYEKKYLEERLDTLVTREEINEYYQSETAEFKLASPLVKGLVVRFPAGFRQEGQMRVMAGTGRKERLQDLVDICIKNNFAYKEFTDWTDLSEVTSSLPRLTNQESARMLTGQPPFEVTQGDNRYFVVITDVLREGNPMPLERASERIRTMIVTKRKQELLRNLEDSLYAAALAGKEITIHIDTLVKLNESQIIE